MNVSNALMKASEGRFFTDMASDPISTLQGIGPKADHVLEALGLTTVAELATYKYFLLARALATLAETEIEGDRPEGSVMNVDKAVDKDWESKTLKEICEAPTAALDGLSDAAGHLLSTLGVRTVIDLAHFKYCRWAEAIVDVSKFEQTKTTAERKQEALLKKLG